MLVQFIAAQRQPVAPYVACPFEGTRNERVPEFLALKPSQLTHIDHKGVKRLFRSA